MASPDLPQTIDEIRLDKKLGEGVFSTVYRAERDGRIYALKLQKSTAPENNADVQRRFVREAATLARLQHPALPRVWTIGEHDGRSYLVMDYVEGAQLDNLEARGTLTSAELAAIGRDVSRALAELHGAGLIHRDIKPSNIIWNGEQTHLVDFGLVGLTVDRLSDARDYEDAVIGTLAYASPEQLRALKRPVDARSDLYSLGAVLYEAVAGRPPYDSTDLEVLMRAHAADEPPDLSDLETDPADPGLHAIIERLIAKEPADRFQSAADTADAFDAYLESLDDHPRREFSASPSGVRVEDLQKRLARVGRRDENDRIRRAWSYFQQIPNGLCTVVAGHPGLGRTRLVSQTLEDLDDPELLLRANQNQSDESQPLDAIAELFSSYLRPGPTDQFADRRVHQLTRAADDIRVSQPVRRLIHRIKGDTADDRTPTPSLQTHQFIGELARLLGTLADDAGPAIIVVDRVESLDLTSRLVVRRLCHLLTQFNIFLLISVDPDDPNGESFFGNLRDDLAFLDEIYGESDSSPDPRRDHPSGIAVHLSPLSTQQVVEYLSLYLNTEFQHEEFAEQIRAASGGSPIVLDQLVDALIERRVIRPDWKGWRVDHERWRAVDIPSDTRDLLARRLDNIDTELLELCRAAAVWGHSFPLPPLAAALGWSDQHAAATAERALRHDLFVESNDSPDDFKFVHTSVRQSLLEPIPESKRRQFHQTYAEWLDKKGELHKEASWSFDLALHYARGTGSAPRRTYETCWRAGRRAADNFAFDRARTFLLAARDAAHDINLDVPAELSYLLGWAHAELGDFDEAEASLRDAIVRAETPIDEARYLIRWADIDATRMEVDPVEESARRALSLLDEPFPSTQFGGLAWLFPRFLRTQYWQRTGPPEPDGDDDRLALRLKSRAYDLIGFSFVFSEQQFFSLCGEIGRMDTSLQLGDSPELVRAYSSSATLNALLDREATARRQLRRGREAAEHIDAPYAELRLKLSETWVDHILGDPVGAAEKATPTLHHHADQLSLLDRSVALEEISVNYALRGFSDQVRYWFRQWYSLHEVRSDKWPPSTMYSTALIHARLTGDDEVADELREVSRESFTNHSRSIYFRKSHLSAITFDNVLLREPPDVVEAPLEARLELGADPTETVFWAKTFFIYAAYARRYLVDHPDTDDREERLETFEIALQRLESAAGDHPTLRSHALLLRAGLLRRRGDVRQTFEFLTEAERIAIEAHNQWALFEVARERARTLEKVQREADSANSVSGTISRRHRTHARDALEIAQDLAWRRRIDDLRREFNLAPSTTDTDTDTRPGSHTGATDTANNLSTRQIDLQRKLDALLDVSMATSSIIDPDEVSEVVVDAAIRVLGAERGLLFLREDDANLEEASPRVVRIAEDADEDAEFDSTGPAGDQPPTFSFTVLERVARTGEAVVVRGTREGADIGADSLVAHDIRSVIAAPLFFDERMVGAIYLDNRLAGGVFSESDVEVLQAIANHIPVALETARTAQLEVEVAAERERRTYAETLRSFTQDVNEMLDVSDILSHLLDHLSDSLDLDEAWGLRIPEHGEPEIYVHLDGGELKQTHGDPHDGDSLPEPGQIVAKIAENPSVHTISPVSDADRSKEPLIGESTENWVALPLGTGRRPVGIVVLASDDPDAFPPGTVEQALAFADQAGIAIEKAMLANTDPLTGVYNRRKFFDIAERELERCRREKQPICALLLDVDNFKTINDDFGHAAGDRALEHIADICERSIRRYDTIARYGGEEFAVLLPATRIEEAEEAADRLRRNIQQAEIPVQETSLSVSVSIGLAELLDDEEGPHSLLERADEAMYLAKRRGKNQVATHRDLN